ncbi:oxidation resistance protein 1-like isoform X2 [Denticeps clupeoides]|nr:oxidation resistance protein 1-like isoform X2 [Denticeps clupeoides]XP_028850483.1 oxidation resistance protein 1-like isoform X2 [Denticeps clupeoides]
MRADLCKNRAQSCGSTEEEEDEDFHIVEWDCVGPQECSSGLWSESDQTGQDMVTDELILNNPSQLLHINQIQQLSRYLPDALIQCTWTLVYNTFSHGTSLSTLYRTMADHDCCTLVIIRDNHEQVFGAFCTAPLKISSLYYGTGQSFLYSFAPHLEVYKWTFTNSYFIKGSKEYLAFGGGGGHFGLWLCGDLNRGRSQKCETFNNDLLSFTEDFFIDAVEVWALV